MPDDIFNKIIIELSDINYQESVCLSFFNEPLLCTKSTERITALRKNLPDCFIFAFTNGEFLSKERIEELSAAGLDLLVIDIYTDSEVFDYNPAEVYTAACALAEKTELQVTVVNNNGLISGVCRIGSMRVELLGRSFLENASNRAESLPQYLPLPKIHGHPKLCIKGFISYHIDYTGGVWPCPNYHRDFAEHKQYCLGNVLNESIFDIYLGQKYSEYRERHFFRRDTLPCRSCIWNFHTFLENRFDRPFKDRPRMRVSTEGGKCSL